MPCPAAYTVLIRRASSNMHVGYSVARDQSAELLDRERLLHQFLDVFAKNVVEPADTIRGQNLEREWQFLSR